MNFSNLSESQLTRGEMRLISGGHTVTIDAVSKCKKCSTNADCPSKVCATYSGEGCDHMPCGCGKYCL